MASLAPGSRLGPYEVVAPLGAGGMGEVWRAKDTRLGREVAIKVLPEHLSSDPEIRARFEREAKTVSGLNHPNICTLFDVGREPGTAGAADTDYLVMELVDGETLAKRLERGALPLAEVLRVGAQIADALDRAHRAGVIHRDLKPGNVMLTRAGAKLMDFGLARSTGLAGGSGSASMLATMTHSPTRAAPLTAEGTIVGTFQYMAPEQLEGREADARADLWAMGCVLYEMATGRRAFDGATQASLISAIMRDVPRPMSELAPMSPPALERLVGALLAKDPGERVQTAHDVKLQLQWAGSESGARSTTGAAAVAVPAGRSRGATLAWSVAAVALALAAASGFMLLRRGDEAPPARARLMVPEPANARLSALAHAFAISPDGRQLVFVAADSGGAARLWLRPLDGTEAEPIPETDNGDMPFWSPDGRAIGYFADGKMRRVNLGGGRPEVLCDAPDPRGATWGSKGVIVFAPVTSGALYSIPAEGGPVTELIRPDSSRGEVALRFPDFLPDGKRFLFISLPSKLGQYDTYLGTLGSHERKFVMRAGSAPISAASNWIVTTLSQRLVALRFDPGSGKPVGKPVTLGEAPYASGHDGTRVGSVSRNGVMIYSAGRRSNTQLGWLDRSGRVTRMLSLPAGIWEDVTISPDDRLAMVSRRITSAEKEMWLVDLPSGQASRFSRNASTSLGLAIWSPEGDRVVYSLALDGPANLYLQRLDGTAPEELVRSPVLFKNPYGWSPDGRFVAFEQPLPETGWDVWMVPMDGDHPPVPLLNGPTNEGGGWFSPDGLWIAYYSDESGGYQMYVRPFPGPGPRHPILGSGLGSAPFVRGCWWSRDGRELAFHLADGQVRTLSLTPGPTWTAGRSRDLFRTSDDVIGIAATSDLQRFLATIQTDAKPPAALVVDVNWTAALRNP